MELSDRLRKEYQRLFETCTLRQSRLDVIDTIAARALKNQARYQKVSDRLGTPWFVVAAIHSLEAGQRFTGHLHNGDPLTGRTFHVPAGRPIGGHPPFTWEQSATDALKGQRFDKVGTWTIPVMLFMLERYNGFGYRNLHPDVLSPYLWSFTNHYSRGKFVADGRFDAGAVSQQCGGVALILRMRDQGHISINQGGQLAALRLPVQEDDVTPDELMDFDSVPSPMLKHNPTVTVRSALAFAMQWSLQGRNAAQAAARDSAAGLEIIKAIAAAKNNQLTAAQIEAAVQKGIEKANAAHGPG